MENLISALTSLHNYYSLSDEATKYFNTKMKKYVQNNTEWVPDRIHAIFLPQFTKNGNNTREILIASPTKSDHRECADEEYQKNIKLGQYVKAKVHHYDTYSILETWLDEPLEKHYRLEVFRDNINRTYSYGYANKVDNQHNPKEIRSRTLKELLPILLQP